MEINRAILRAALAASIQASAEASTYYVATTGNDAHTCVQAQNAATPKLTVAAGLACIGTARGAGAGHIVEVAAGSYNEYLIQNLPTGSSWSLPFTLRAKAGHAVVLKPLAAKSTYSPIYLWGAGPGSAYIVVEGLTIDAIHAGGSTASGSNGITIGDPSWSHIVFKNLEIKNTHANGALIGANNIQFIDCHVHHIGRDGSSQSTGQNVPGPDVPPGLGRGHGFYILGSANLVDRCLIHDVGEYGVKFYTSHVGASSNNNMIRNSRIYRAGQNTTRYGHTCCGGILLASGKNNRAFNNVIHDSNTIYQHGIDAGYSATNALIYNNTIYNTGVGLWTGPSSAGAVFKNNIVIRSSNRNMVDTSTTSVKSHNLCDTSGTGCTHVGDPKFAGAAGGDFHLLAGSAAIDQGADLSAAGVTGDIEGTTRPQGARFDIGAYEFGATAPIAAAPAKVRGLRWR